MKSGDDPLTNQHIHCEGSFAYYFIVSSTFIDISLKVVLCIVLYFAKIVYFTYFCST